MWRDPTNLGSDPLLARLHESFDKLDDEFVAYLYTLIELHPNGKCWVWKPNQRRPSDGREYPSVPVRLREASGVRRTSRQLHRLLWMANPATPYDPDKHGMARLCGVAGCEHPAHWVFVTDHDVYAFRDGYDVFMARFTSVNEHLIYRGRIRQEQGAPLLDSPTKLHVPLGWLIDQFNGGPYFSRTERAEPHHTCGLSRCYASAHLGNLLAYTPRDGVQLAPVAPEPDYSQMPVSTPSVIVLDVPLDATLLSVLDTAREYRGMSRSEFLNWMVTEASDDAILNLISTQLPLTGLSS